MDFRVKTENSASDQVEAYFRSAIASRKLKPGEKLPSNQVLADKLNVSGTVIHTALSRLVQDGLIERTRRKGTYVRKFQEKANIALFFGPSLTDETAHYYRAILKRFNEDCAARKWGLRHWGGLNSEIVTPPVLERSREQIVREHLAYPFTGFIEFSPGRKSVVPAEISENVPFVSYGENPIETEIRDNSYHFGFEAASSLIKSGCRKIFYFCTVWHARSFTDSIDGLLDSARKQGVSAPMVHVEPYSTQGYEMEVAMHRRMKGFISEWRKTGFPDGLVVNDDVTMRAIAPAILEAGVKIPTDMKIFSEGNEDVRFHYGFPVTRYEISPKAITEFLLNTLERKINGLSPQETNQPRTYRIHHENV